MAISSAGLIGNLACTPQEPVRLDLPIRLDPTEIETVTTDLGYDVTLSEAKVMARDLSFAVAGEAHLAALLVQPYDWIVPSAFAHPGHYQGGDITGELAGRFLFDWLPGENLDLGVGSLLVGNYTSANFYFDHATEADLNGRDDDLLVGHTALLRGTAQKADRQVHFLALLDAPVDRQLVGVPFEYELKESSEVELHLFLDPLDPLEGDTLFDGLDFLSLDEDADGEIAIVPKPETDQLNDAYNRLRRTLQTHDHYRIKALPLDKETSPT